MATESIKVINLLNGQELVGSVTILQDGYKIKNPLMVVPQPHPNGNSMGFGFMPWPLFADGDEFHISHAHVVVSYAPRKELFSGYEETIGKMKAAKSGLIVPNPKPRLIIE